MKEFYTDTNFRPASLDLIGKIEIEHAFQIEIEHAEKFLAG
jgi:hypothetical protein